MTCLFIAMISIKYFQKKNQFNECRFFVDGMTVENYLFLFRQERACLFAINLNYSKYYLFTFFAENKHNFIHTFIRNFAFSPKTIGIVNIFYSIFAFVHCLIIIIIYLLQKKIFGSVSVKELIIVT